MIQTSIQTIINCFCNLKFVAQNHEDNESISFASSGDAASPGRTNFKCMSKEESYGCTNMQPSFPQSSPWVLAVGATFILNSQNKVNFTNPICHYNSTQCYNGLNESTASISNPFGKNIKWTSGAGFSHFNQQSAFQKELVRKYLFQTSYPNPKFFNLNGLAYPDVVVVCHHCPVFFASTKKVSALEGTSCSAPIMAGLISHLNRYQLDRNRSKLGYVNPLLYSIYDRDPNTFHDITSGNSSCTIYNCCDDQFGFRANSGWNFVSGLGSPNVDLIKFYLPGHIEL